MFVVDDILMFPITGMKFIFKTLIKTAEEQWNDDAPLKEELMQLQVALDEGSISEDEYVERESAILRDLRAIQERKMQAAGFDPNAQAPAEGLTGAGVTGTVEANLGWGPSTQESDKK